MVALYVVKPHNMFFWDEVIAYNFVVREIIEKKLDRGGENVIMPSISIEQYNAGNSEYNKGMYVYEGTYAIINFDKFLDSNKLSDNHVLSQPSLVYPAFYRISE